MADKKYSFDYENTQNDAERKRGVKAEDLSLPEGYAGHGGKWKKEIQGQPRSSRRNTKIYKGWIPVDLGKGGHVSTFDKSIAHRKRVPPSVLRRGMHEWILTVGIF
jgi:hypothetical protein